MLTYKTEIHWGRALTLEEMSQVNTKLAELTSQEKTDGTKYTQETVLGNVVERHWATEEDAQEWIDFFKDFTPPIIEFRINKL